MLEMKSRAFYKIIILLMFFSFSTRIQAQRCGRKAACTIEIDDSFDYRGQSTYATLYPSDTANTKIVVYSGQVYNIFLCGEPQLGTIEFNILKLHRKYRNVIDEVIESENILYKQDEYGDYVYDEYGDYIEIGRETVHDTLWIREKYIEKEILFNNFENKSGTPNWKIAITKTQTLLVEVIVSENASEGCMDLFIGHRTKHKSQFKR